MPSLIDDLNSKYFDGELPQGVLKYFDLESMNSESRETVEQVFRRNNMAELGATEFSEWQAWLWGTYWPKMSESNWGGMVPPVTFKGRHIKIDEYIRANPWTDMSGEGILLDLGCGYPPLTTVEAAERFADWQVIGADPGLPSFMVYDEHGNYAAFGPDGELRYFQWAEGASIDDVEELLGDPEPARESFTRLYERLLPDLPDVGPEDLASVEHGGARLIKNPTREYERANLSFLHGGIGEVEMEGVDVARCFNVLSYFDRAFRDRALVWMSEVLNPGGVFICGSDVMKSTESWYTVYRNEDDGLVEKEFALSIDNLRPTIFHAVGLDDDHDINRKVETVRVVRADLDFRRDFDAEMDKLQSELNLLKRNEEGFLEVVDWAMPVPEIGEAMAEVVDRLDRDGYVDGAVSVLKRAGYDAWRNQVGHIGVAPTV